MKIIKIGSVYDFVCTEAEKKASMRLRSYLSSGKPCGPINPEIINALKKGYALWKRTSIGRDINEEKSWIFFLREVIKPATVN